MKPKRSRSETLKIMSRLSVESTFELLGYHLYYRDNDTIIWQLKGINLWKNVVFDLLNKTYACYYSTTDNSFMVNLPLNKAIQQQMKELGWIDE